MVSTTSTKVRNTTNNETASNKSSSSERRRPDSAYSSHQPIHEEEVSGESYGLNWSANRQLPTTQRVLRLASDGQLVTVEVSSKSVRKPYIKSTPKRG